MNMICCTMQNYTFFFFAVRGYTLNKPSVYLKSRREYLSWEHTELFTCAKFQYEKKHRNSTQRERAIVCDVLCTFFQFSYCACIRKKTPLTLLHREITCAHWVSRSLWQNNIFPRYNCHIVLQIPSWAIPTVQLGPTQTLKHLAQTRNRWSDVLAFIWWIVTGSVTLYNNKCVSEQEIKQHNWEFSDLRLGKGHFISE